MGELILPFGQTKQIPTADVFHVKTPTAHCRWEYHPGKKTLFIIRDASPQHGEAVATDIENADIAVIAVQSWLRGWKERDHTLALGLK